LPLVTREFGLYLVHKFLFYFLKGDQGWFEEYGRVGLILINKNFSYKIGLLNFVRIKYIYIFILVVLFIFLF